MHENIALIFVVEVADAHVVRITGVTNNINIIKIFRLLVKTNEQKCGGKWVTLCCTVAIRLQ